MKCSVQWAFHFSKHLVGCFVISVIATERKKLEHVFMIIGKPSADRLYWNWACNSGKFCPLTALPYTYLFTQP
jgi:hypothetical protein